MTNKPVCVISTVGQSVFLNAAEPLRKDFNEFRRRSDVELKPILEKEAFDGHDLYENMLAYLRALRAPNLRGASAELNSLDRILEGRTLTRADQLHFLASDTPDGVLAARVIADFCREHFGLKEREQVTLHHITGLQVSDGTRFRREGLRSLIDCLYKILKKAPAGTYTRILNPTGGFKGVVPYLTVVGMLENVQVSYIYEQSSALLTLAGLPVTLDYERLRPAYKALDECSRRNLLSADELKDLLGLAEGQAVGEHPAWPLFERVDIDGQPTYALNGLGQIVYQHLKDYQRPKVYLSRQADERYSKLDKTEQERFAAHFEALRDPTRRKGKRHGKKGEAIIYKPGNVAERLFYFELEDGDVLVAELASHADRSYEEMPDLKRRDYAPHRRWEGE